MVWWFRWDRNHQGRDLCTSRTHNWFTWSGLIIYSRGDIRRDDQCFNLLLWCHCFFLCWIHAYNMDWVGMCKITRNHLVKWRWWYLIPLNRQLLQTVKQCVHWGRTTGSCDRASSYIPGLITTEMIRGSPCYFGAIIFFGSLSVIQWDFLHHFNYLGKWSHEDDCRFGGKLPKCHNEKAQVQMIIREPRMLWWWKFKRCWLLISTTSWTILSFWNSFQHLLKLN